MIDEKIIKQFNIPGKIINLEQKTNGIINKTYVATYENNNRKEKYLIQQINDNVFKNPYELMNNIEGVTNHIKNKMKVLKDDKHKTLDVIKTVDNENLLISKNEEGKNEYYRTYSFIDNSICFDTSEDEEIVRNAGKGFGNFQKLLDDYSMDSLAETIKDFHNTKKRFEHFESSVKDDKVGRVNLAQKEIEFIEQRKGLSSLIVDKLANGEIPLRVTHNDTKVNNVMMNNKTKDFLAVIDLDTVMPGSGLYDYGDGIRSASSNASEDETNLDKVFIKNSMFEAYTDGYLSELAPYMKEEEVKLMGKSIEILTYELAMRFLDDYLNGDTYFTCNYENHNLDRARNQMRLVEDIESKMDYINGFIWGKYQQYK